MDSRRASTVKALAAGMVAGAVAARTRTQPVHESADRDAVTGLPLRSIFSHLSDSTFRRMQKGERIGLVFLDLDGFQMFNDSFGHDAGDEVLRSVARRVQGVVRDGDIVARVGADEFAVVCEHVKGLDELLGLARRFLTTLRSPFDVHDQQVFLGAHVGIAVSDDATTSLVQLVRDADTAMHRAKTNGLAWAVYDPAMRESSRRFLAMASDLRHAVTRHQLRVEYQPIVCLPDGKPFALEALARWDHPHGAVPPDEFIAVAEKAGLIAEIGEWVLHQAVAAAVRWGELNGAAAPKVSVNVSAHQLLDPDFIYSVTRCLEQWQLPFARLVLEVTESAVMENVELANESLGVLSGLGVQIAVDDFGAGTSSLAQLKKLRWIDILKIDKSFVAGLGEDEEASSIVETIIALARALKMSVVAEGVETDVQAAQLMAAGCDHAQGWHFGRPLRPRATDSLVRGGQRLAATDLMSDV
jgi:diguanylate cyclase (GGDEF)-like protein